MESQILKSTILKDALVSIRGNEGKIVREFEIEGKRMTITKASEEDLIEIGGFDQQHFDVGQPYTVDDYRNHVRPIGETFLIHDENQRLIGITSVLYGPSALTTIEMEEDDAYFEGSILLPEMRGKGISKYINEVREQSAAEKNMKRVLTVVRPDNPRSIGALKKAGFSIIKAQKNIVPPYQDDDGTRLIMVKDLQ